MIVYTGIQSAAVMIGPFEQGYYDYAAARTWMRKVVDDAYFEDRGRKAGDLKKEELVDKSVTELSDKVCKAALIIEKFLSGMEINGQLKQELHESQKSVIGLQQQLLEAKDVQLKAVTSVVEEKVSEVRQEVKDYSAAVRSGSVTGGVTLSQADVKSAVRTALVNRADEEGREGNVVVFGMVEETGEKVTGRVTELLEELGVKPKFTAERVGKIKMGDMKRPIKVVFKNSLLARQVLKNAPKLRESEKFKDVFISPDRTPEQRLAQRELVAELKRKRSEESDKKHFIRSGRLESIEKQ